MLTLYSVFFRKIRNRTLLNLLVAFGMLAIGILNKRIELIKDLPTIINNTPLMVVIAVGTVFFILSAYTFYEFLALHFLFRLDLLKLFPISYLSYIIFWAILFGFYYVFKLDCNFIPFTPSRWNHEIITACIGLALLTTSGFSLLNTGSFHSSKQEENKKEIKGFRTIRLTIINTLFNQRKTASTNRSRIKTENKNELCRHLNKMNSALQTIISTEEKSNIRTKYERIQENLQELTNADHGIAKLDLDIYLNLLIRAPVPKCNKFNHLLDSIENLSSYYTEGNI